MALLKLSETWIGVQRVATESLGNRDSWYPKSYVTLTLDDGKKINMSADSAKQLSKALTAAARLIDPPKPRVKRS